MLFDQLTFPNYYSFFVSPWLPELDRKNGDDWDKLDFEFATLQLLNNIAPQCICSGKMAGQLLQLLGGTDIHFKKTQILRHGRTANGQNEKLSHLQNLYIFFVYSPLNLRKIVFIRCFDGRQQIHFASVILMTMK